MSEITIPQPHDSFFKKSLSNLTVAKDLLQAHLSPSITQRIHWDTLKLSNKSFVDEKLSQRHSDVVYTCQVDGQAVYIYTLVEQQTKPDPLLPFRCLQYNVALMEEHLENSKHKKQLPIIINLCLYSGKQTPYPYSVDIYDCFEDPTLARVIMFKPLDMIDLGQIEEEELSKHGTADLLEMLLKQSQARTFLNWMKNHPEAVRKLLERCYGISGIMYILGVEKRHGAEELLQTIENIVPEKKEDIMTAAQQLELRGEQRGEQRGELRGIQKGKLIIAKNMLSKGFASNLIQEIAGISEEEFRQLEKTYAEDN